MGRRTRSSRRSNDRPRRAGKPSTGRRGPAGSQHARNAGRSLVNTGARWPSLEQAEPQVLAMQTKLHQWAISDPDRLFDDIYNLLYAPAFLVVAWDRVRSNKGARSAGVDGIAPRSIDPRGGGVLGGIRDEMKGPRYT